MKHGHEEERERREREGRERREREKREREEREREMASTQISPELVWQCVKGGNAFAVRSPTNVWFSKEKGNLYSKHSYKYSGVANDSTVDITDTGEGLQAKITTKLNKTIKKTTLKQDFKGMSKNTVKEAKATRKDLAVRSTETHMYMYIRNASACRQIIECVAHLCFAQCVASTAVQGCRKHHALHCVEDTRAHTNTHTHTHTHT